MLPWLICAALAALALVLLLRLYLLQKSLDDITGQLGERLLSDTNSPIFLPTRDPHARRLAGELNVQLRELRRLRQRYENGDRELKEAVTNVSHDLRTPLTAICGYLDLLEGEETSPDAARYLDLIRDRTDHLRQLTEEFFQYAVALSSRSGGSPEAVSLGPALEESLAAWYPVLSARGIAPEIRLPEEPVVRQLDRAALGRVLGNILSNAVKYSAGDLSVSLEADGTLTFSNTAPGMTALLAQKLFDRYFTVQTGRQATGLGLSIARQLTEAMGGSVEAQCQGEVLTVTVRFP